MDINLKATGFVKPDLGGGGQASKIAALRDQDRRRVAPKAVKPPPQAFHKFGPQQADIPAFCCWLPRFNAQVHVSRMSAP